METLSIVPTTENVKMFISIEQGDYKHEAEFSFNELPVVQQVANIALNETYSFISIQKLLVSQKSRPSLAKAFTFSIAFEQGDKSAILNDFATKITLGEAGQKKLIANMPAVLANLLLSKTMLPADRLIAIRNPAALKLELA